MDTQWISHRVHEAQGDVWVESALEAYKKGDLCAWVSTFHPRKLECRSKGLFIYGSFNMALKVIFRDGTAWMVRFPRGGIVHKAYADEKVAMEVIALRLLRSKTTIPVPKVKAWGDAASNPLGLGPFIMMEFIEGVDLIKIIRAPNSERLAAPMREDLSMDHIETLYKQMADFLLQIFEMDFDRIGSLQSTSSDFQREVPVRPLTLKTHSIMQDGDVNTFGKYITRHSNVKGFQIINILHLGDRSSGFKTATEYLSYLVDQEWEQLIHQHNSTFGPKSAEAQYKASSAMRELMPQLVHPEYDGSKFKFICDDFGLGNLIVRSEDDMTVVGVVDLEWSYIGPAQMLASAPWWLLMDRPVNVSWDYDGKTNKAPEVVERYFKHLDIFTRILEEEEAKRPTHEKKECSRLLKWSRESGAMWLHMILTNGFNQHDSFVYRQLRDALEPRWSEYIDELDEEEVEAFGQRKVKDLELYDEALAGLDERQKLMDDGVITKLQFIEQSLKR
ncbi:hypothetical protein N7456_001283 [Penicillium angulare]|uniref:Aminoglycoside phosphotransferase domain-containing protein n=1 Tax=Penicillium angulare TaxID=116970 RepID=A0A9W9GER7_9EURO|nr:hypothetical protein N7456_001283 [Penicillium angulare]